MSLCWLGIGGSAVQWESGTLASTSSDPDNDIPDLCTQVFPVQPPHAQYLRSPVAGVTSSSPHFLMNNNNKQNDFKDPWWLYGSWKKKKSLNCYCNCMQLRHRKTVKTIHTLFLSSHPPLLILRNELAKIGPAVPVQFQGAPHWSNIMAYPGAHYSEALRKGF